MKRLAILLAVVIGLIPGITSQVAHSDSLIAYTQTPGKSVHSGKENMLEVNGGPERNIAEINFTVRMYLWALDQRQVEILAKVTAPVFQAKFSDVRTMMGSMSLVHRPVMGAKNIFLHTPDLSGNQSVQTVFFVGRHSNHWMGKYSLSRNDNGQYGITDVIIKKLAGEFS